MPEEKCSRPDEISILVLEAAICDESYYPSQLGEGGKREGLHFMEASKYRCCLTSQLRGCICLHFNNKITSH